MNKALIILFLFFIPKQLLSQVLPKEGSMLNYRLIGFSFPPSSQANAYKIEIAAGNYKTVDSFRKKIILSASGKRNKIIAEVPTFGSEYTWRVVYTGNKIKESPLYHFTTQMNEHVDTTKLRLKILKAAETNRDAYVAVEEGGILYDMNGRPVWFNPDKNGIGGSVADLKFTDRGTITFIHKDLYEINYNGDILWKAPNKGIVSGDTALGESYHHEFTRLSNGHYMALGMEWPLCKSVSVNDSNYIIFSNDKNEQNGFQKGRFSTLIEYDKKGNIVWSWKSLNYLERSDFNYFNPVDPHLKFYPHENAFFFDEKNKCIYLGYRNLNRIIKIEYPSGKVLNTYGGIFKPCALEMPESIFCNQHSIGRTHDGYLYVFNNNSCNNTDALPTIVLLKEPVSGKDSLEKVWEYTCTVEGDYKKRFFSGGNVIELSDSSLFVNMGSEYSRLFIVNRKKKELWSALPERYIETDAKWVPMHEYRANIISREGLEKLIWAAETTK